ncbi:MAG TPA: phosphate ABC transporter substrate-binding protein PstS [Acidimicrobiales bacterium]|nr:phosphate ABC transporter substrate-binding protein PstS [Acidimicrobiales bacterium]
MNTLMRATRLTRGAIVVAAAGLALSSVVIGSAASASVKLPSGGVEKPSGGTVSETGSTLLYPLFNLWAGGYNTKYPSMTIQTAGTGSGTGISEAENGTIDVGASDAYLSPSVVSANPDLKNIPLAISAQIVAYNVPGVLSHLKLSGKVLSEIYQGQITKWNASAIASLNPGVTLPSTPIVTLHRSDSSGDTFLWTTYLSKADPSGWGTKIGYNTTVQWPAAPGALGESGNSGMVSGCKATPGCIAYVGISYLTQALQAGLGYAALGNAKGQYIVPTQASVAAEAAGFVKKTPANGTISLIYGNVNNGYPIINYEYAIVSTHQPSSSTAKNIRSLLEWASNSKYGNNSSYLSQVNFQPLPSKVEAQTVKQILSIQ